MNQTDLPHSSKTISKNGKSVKLSVCSDILSITTNDFDAKTIKAYLQGVNGIDYAISNKGVAYTISQYYSATKVIEAVERALVGLMSCN